MLASKVRLAGLDFDLADDLFRLLLLGQVEGEDAVFELGFNGVVLHAIGQVEGALEAAVDPLLAEVLAFLFFASRALFRRRSTSVPSSTGDLDVLLLQSRQFGRDFEGGVVFLDVDARAKSRVAPSKRAERESSPKKASTSVVETGCATWRLLTRAVGSKVSDGHDLVSLLSDGWFIWPSPISIAKAVPTC